MKKALIATALSTTLVSPVIADEWILGATVGLLRPGGDSGQSTPALTGSALLALEFLNLGIVDIGATFEYTKSITQAEVDNQDTTVRAKAAWLTARTLGPLYAVARTGLIELELQPNAGNLSGQRDKALSVGLGFSVGLRSRNPVTPASTMTPVTPHTGSDCCGACRVRTALSDQGWQPHTDHQTAAVAVFAR